MHARVGVVSIKPGTLDEVIKIASTLLDAIRSAHGFRSWSLLADRAENRILAINVWDTEADLKAGHASDGYVTRALAQLAPYLAGPVQFEHFEVNVAVGPEAGAACARVTVGQFKVDQLDEALALYRTEILPIIQTRSGFKGTLILIDADTGSCHATSFWASAADRAAGEAPSGYYTAALQRLAPYFAGPTGAHHYEVCLQA